MATKQSGCFAFGRKPKAAQQQKTLASAAPEEEPATIDSIYNHIMKQTPDESARSTTNPAPSTEEATQLFSY